MRPKLVLASGSPRRLALLEQAGITPDALRPVSVDESVAKGEVPRHIVRRLARAKAEAARKLVRAEPALAKAFIIAADTAKFAGKANAQLVQSGQAKQVKCPLSGGKLNPEQKTTVAGVEVGFCCDKCKGKVEGATGDEQLNLVLSDAAFKKGFEIKK